MSPIVFIVFAPVVLGGIAFAALLLGAATAGAWEAVERRPSAARPAPSLVARQERAPARAA